MALGTSRRRCNKAIVVNRTLLFAYTGHACIASQRTDLWFAEVIKPFADRDRLKDGIREVARRATEYFSRQRHIPSKYKLHTFIGVGWQRRRTDGKLIPIATRISNAFDDQHQPLSEARPEFVVHENRLQRLSGIRILASGVLIEQERLIHLERLLRRIYYLDSPMNTARFLAKEIRSVADKLGANGQVGKSLIVTCLPNAAMLLWSEPILGPPDGKSLWTFYIPSKGNQQVRMSSTIVQKGFPLLLTDMGFSVPPPADGSDPYVGWR